jgi:hypothetical protein
MSAGQLAICALSDQLTEAISDLGESLHLNVQRLEDVGGMSEDELGCGLTDCSTEAGQSMCRGIRLSSLLADLPLIAVVEDPWSAQVQQAFGLGVDDYLPASSVEQLKNKLLALRAEGAPSGSYLSGKVVLADPERERRVHLGRHLRRMGLEVDFAVDDQLPDDPRVKLVVAHCALASSGVGEAIAQYREGPGAKIPWIITGTRSEIDEARKQVEDAEDVVYFDLDSDPTQIAFTANKMLVGKSRSLRRSERIDFETPIHIMIEDNGGAEIWGYSYNINLGGLYVRTLTPPALGTLISMEYTPPYGRGRVLVEGKVVWRQEYSKGKGYPSGFGVQYDELPVADGAALEAGYTRLAQEKGTAAGEE